ncbi:hypothetical protein B4U79_01678 [Dinothrombium tinctorium]|uniref:Uncharacterized protein n=1 Tax=Dinothrombium tinctorium TaxID=1965070 RepID=A0A3S3P9E2_9ACAR|nr:hypothetical protein B4U79_01678 [Dinothrombium tinctorium]
MSRKASFIEIENVPKTVVKNGEYNKLKLEDYIYELQSRDMHANNTTNGDEIVCKESSDQQQTLTPESLAAQLAQKEKDLILAAELGKALLERNEDLTRANERITEEYSHKLEVRRNLASFELIFGFTLCCKVYKNALNLFEIS